METNFANKLNTFKQTRNLSVQELAQKAGVSGGLISGLLHGYRIIGEKTARKIAKALDLRGTELQDFIYLAINGCSEKVLNSSKGFPSEMINLVTNELNSLGILPEKIARCVRMPVSKDAQAALYLNDGRTALIHVEVAIK